MLHVFGKFLMLLLRSIGIVYSFVCVLFSIVCGCSLFNSFCIPSKELYALSLSLSSQIPIDIITIRILVEVSLPLLDSMGDGGVPDIVAFPHQRVNPPTFAAATAGMLPRVSNTSRPVQPPSELTRINSDHKVTLPIAIAATPPPMVSHSPSRSEVSRRTANVAIEALGLQGGAQLSKTPPPSRGPTTPRRSAPPAYSTIAANSSSYSPSIVPAPTVTTSTTQPRSPGTDARPTPFDEVFKTAE